jgi:hypothetical protein
LVIKASSSAEIRGLVEALSADDDVQRDVAVARLGIIGARAVDRLLAVYADTANRRTRTAILRTLEAIADHRSLAPARDALLEGGSIAVAATGVLRSLLTSANAAVATSALDALVAASLDGTREQTVRLAAFEALRDMPEETREPLAAALRRDPSNVIHAAAGGEVVADAARTEAIWSDALAGRLPEVADDLREALAQRGQTAPLNTLRILVDAVRAREAQTDAAAKAGWLALRGALHQALALRGSRVALYDVRETLEARPVRLPASFLAAVHVLGDATCLEPLAATWGAAGGDPSPDGLRFRQQLAAAFAAVVSRERITKRHATLKRIAGRWPELVTDLR